MVDNAIKADTKINKSESAFPASLCLSDLRIRVWSWSLLSPVSGAISWAVVDNLLDMLHYKVNGNCKASKEHGRLISFILGEGKKIYADWENTKHNFLQTVPTAGEDILLKYFRYNKTYLHNKTAWWFHSGTRASNLVHYDNCKTQEPQQPSLWMAPHTSHV